MPTVRWATLRMEIANRNTFLIDPQGKIVKVWTKVDLGASLGRGSGRDR